MVTMVTMVTMLSMVTMVCAARSSGHKGASMGAEAYGRGMLADPQDIEGGARLLWLAAKVGVGVGVGMGVWSSVGV